MSEQLQDKQSQARSNWMKYTLLASLGVNLVIVGLVAGFFLRVGPPAAERPTREAGALGLGLYVGAMDKENRRLLSESIRGRSAEFSTGRAVIQRHRKALAEALVAEPFDIERVREELAKQSATIGGNIAAGHVILLERIEKMDAEARQNMAKRLKSPRPHRP